MSAIAEAKLVRACCQTGQKPQAHSKLNHTGNATNRKVLFCKGLSSPRMYEECMVTNHSLVCTMNAQLCRPWNKDILISQVWSYGGVQIVRLKFGFKLSHNVRSKCWVKVLASGRVWVQILWFLSSCVRFCFMFNLFLCNRLEQDGMILK